jgi:hypothetical protein
MSPDEIVRRCTRDGVTSWQSVAKQLGLSVDAARSRYDPAYLRARPWPHPCEEVPHPDAPIDENDVHSLAPKGPGLKALILRHLQTGPASVETLANRLQRPVNSIRARLDRLLDEFLVCHDDCYPRSWSLTAKGLRMAVTGCEVQARKRV